MARDVWRETDPSGVSHISVLLVISAGRARDGPVVELTFWDLKTTTRTCIASWVRTLTVVARDGPVGGQVPPNPPTRARAHTNILAVAWCRDDDVVPQNLVIIIIKILLLKYYY